MVFPVNRGNKIRKPLMHRITPWLFVLPGLILTILLSYYPMIKAFYISLFDFNPINQPGQFIGLKNFIDIFNQQAYWNAWINTFMFLLLTLGITFLVPIIQAIFLSELGRGREFMSTIYLVSTLVPISVNVILWKWIWHPDYGLANHILSYFNIAPQLWLSDPNWTKFCIVFPGIIGGGVIVLMYLASILSIPEEIIESARIDGCSGWKRIFFITLPNIRNIIFLQFLLAVIYTMQILDGPFQFTKGGPAGVSTSMGVYIYKTAMEGTRNISYGRANAASVVFFLLLVVITIVQMRFNRSESEM